MSSRINSLGRIRKMCVVMGYGALVCSLGAKTYGMLQGNGELPCEEIGKEQRRGNGLKWTEMRQRQMQFTQGLKKVCQETILRKKSVAVMRENKLCQDEKPGEFANKAALIHEGLDTIEKSIQRSEEAMWKVYNGWRTENLLLQKKVQEKDRKISEMMIQMQERECCTAKVIANAQASQQNEAALAKELETIRQMLEKVEKKLEEIEKTQNTQFLSPILTKKTPNTKANPSHPHKKNGEDVEEEDLLGSLDNLFDSYKDFESPQVPEHKKEYHKNVTLLSKQAVTREHSKKAKAQSEKGFICPMVVARPSFSRENAWEKKEKEEGKKATPARKVPEKEKVFGKESVRKLPSILSGNPTSHPLQNLKRCGTCVVVTKNANHKKVCAKNVR